MPIIRAASVAALALLALAVDTRTACGADAYPTRPVKIMVGAGAGGGTDVIARMLGREVRRRPRSSRSWSRTGRAHRTRSPPT